MEKPIISELQPLFCSRASIIKAKETMASTNLDCQLRLRIADGRDIALNIDRNNIGVILDTQLNAVEESISQLLTNEETTEKQPQNELNHEQLF